MQENIWLVYQLQYSLTQKTIVGAEVLVRWDRGSARELISLYRKRGEMRSLDTWVFGEAIAQLKRWHREGYGIPLSINAGQEILTSGYLGQWLPRAIAPLDPSFVEIEISEQFVLTRAITREVNRLSRLGFRVAVDDYGTAYSSLSRFLDLPVNTIKVDRLFIIKQSPISRAIIKKTAEFAEDIGARCVAEGVETRSQSQELEILGCDIIQGYHYSWPCPADRTTVFLEALWGVAHEVGCLPNNGRCDRDRVIGK